MRKIFTTFLILFITANVLLAQSRVITGTVLAAKDNSPLPGVTVSVSDHSMSTATDINGKYSISIPATARSISYSMIGMKSLKQEIGAGNIMNVSLEEDVLNLDEVVVTALGVKKEKKQLGYAVQDIKGDELVAGAQGNMLNALSGKVAGVQVTTSSGSPGASSFIKLRGSNSILGNNQPLLVLDGVPIDNSQNYTGNPDDLQNNLLDGVGYSNRAVDINPNDIASITVLKGANATALYGLRASNGAIIITTKKGYAGNGKGVSVSVNSSVSVDMVNRFVPLQNMYSQGSYYTDLIYGSGEGHATYSGPDYVEDAILGGYPKQVSWGALLDTLRYDGDNTYAWDPRGRIVGMSDPSATDQRVVPFDHNAFFKSGISWNNNVSINGGGEFGTIRFSLGDMRQSGVIPLSNFQRTNVSLNAEAAVFDWLKASTGVLYTHSGGRRIQQGSNTSGLMLGLLRTPPNFDNSNALDNPIENEAAYVFADGTQRNYRGGYGYDNPYWTINRNPFYDDVNRMIAHVQADAGFTSWLKGTYRLGTDMYSDMRKQGFDIASATASAGRVIDHTILYRSINSDLILTAERRFNDKWNGTLSLGQNIYSEKTTEQYVQGDGLTLPEFYDISNAAQVFSKHFDYKLRTMAIYADARVDFNNYLFLNVSGRNEWSSTLPNNNRSFFYPSASLAFVFTEPLNMSSNRILPYGKVRFSFTQVGNDAPLYATRTSFNSTAISDGWVDGVIFPIDGTAGFTRADELGNDEIRPERTNSFELGTELKFFQGRLGLDVTAYNSLSNDQILQVPIASSTGYAAALLNTGSVRNRGLEIQLTASPVKSENFEWDLGLNWSLNRNKVMKLADGIDNVFLGGFEGSDIRAIEGEAYGVIYGVDYLRDDQGRLIICDDPTSYEYGFPVADLSASVIGDPNPDWLMGLQTSLRWKGLSLNALFDIKYGGDLWNGTQGALSFFGTSELTENRGTTEVFEGVKGHLDADGNIEHYVTDSTTESGIGATNDIEALLGEDWYTGNGGGFGSVSKQFVQDAGFLKLREISLSYQFPAADFKKGPLKGASIGIFARNFILYTKYQGVDPETSLMGSDNAQGIDYFNMPNTQSMGLQLKLDF